MRKGYLFFFMLLLFSSCRNYFDVKKNNEVTNYYAFSLEAHDNFNIIKTLPRLNSKSDKQVNFRQDFQIKIPKKIISWSVVENQFFFEYEDYQILIIDSGYDNFTDSLHDWKFIDIGQEGAEIYLNEYWRHKNYNLLKLSDTAKVYTDGKTKILLYNIKEKNLDNFLDLINSFEYK